MVDTPPSMIYFIKEIIVTSDYLIIPVALEFIPVNSTKNLLKTIEDVKKESETNVEVLGILPTKYIENSERTKEILKMLDKIKGKK